MFMRPRFFRFFLFLSLFFLLVGGLRNISYRNAYYRGFQDGLRMSLGSPKHKIKNRMSLRIEVINK